ncbi:putative capsid protein [Idotea virus IWaV278]|uniref:Putative capsid protein n=1 Tax=Idotea virus IWaV278 TaxID=2058759 RepID=A0A2H4YQ33_9VIRU|nr:putative capsid protein [Idotea virus IWaV278]
MSKKRKTVTGGGSRRSTGVPYWQMKAARQYRDDYMAEYPRGSAASKAMWGDDYKSASKRQRYLRNAMRFKGKGKYSAKNFGRDALRYGGAALGGGIGYMTGGLAGAGAMAQRGYDTGADLSRFVGFGEYKGANQLIAGPEQNMSITVNREHRSGDIVFANTEFVQNVYAGVTSGPSTSKFQTQAFSLNPGLGETFPFLSQIAQNFELFEFEGLMFEYKPTSGEFGTTSSNSLGKVVMCTNYDPEAPEFQNSVQMENYDYANSTKPSRGAIHGVETHPDQRATKLMYVRTGDANKSKLFTDLGTLHLATEGVPFGGDGQQKALIGELWVTYKVRLSRSQLYSSVLGNNVITSYQSGTSDSGVWTGTKQFDSNTWDMSLTNVSQGVFKFTLPEDVDDGSFLVTISNSSTGTHTMSPLEFTLENCKFTKTPVAIAPPPSQVQGWNRTYLMKVDAQSALNICSFQFDDPDSNWPNGSWQVGITQVSDKLYDEWAAFSGELPA